MTTSNTATPPSLHVLQHLLTYPYGDEAIPPAHELLQGFIQFVFSRDNDEVIQHFQGWNRCAVGKFVLAVIPDSHTQRMTDWQEVLLHHEDGLDATYPELYNCLNTAWDNELVPTYGHLKDWIRSNQVEALLELSGINIESLQGS